jgi:hypothetical protein
VRLTAEKTMIAFSSRTVLLDMLFLGVVVVKNYYYA